VKVFNKELETVRNTTIQALIGGYGECSGYPSEYYDVYFDGTKIQTTQTVSSDDNYLSICFDGQYDFATDLKTIDDLLEAERLVITGAGEEIRHDGFVEFF